MKIKRKIFNLFAAVVMIFGSMPISFVNTYAADDEPTEIVPEEENIPKSLKTLHVNGDGTYDITLEIEGVSRQKTDATKANVVVVFDSSGSMNRSETIYTYSQSASGRYRKVDSEYVQLYRRSYGVCSRMDSDNSSTQVYTTYNDCVNRRNQYTGTRYTRAATSGTRIEAARSAVNVLANELLSQNDSSTPDLVEMAFIDFATSVKSNLGPTTNLNTFRGWVNATSPNGGTNWEAALTAAKDVSFDDNDKTYIIFVSDGDPTFRDSKYDSSATDNCYRENYYSPWICDEVWGSGSDDPNGWNFDAAKDVADVIIGTENVEFYTVGTFGDTTVMKKLGGTFYDATDQDALEEAFAKIVDKINMGISVADLQIEDGITPATSTEVDGTAGNFRYSVPDSWGDDWQEATYTGGSVHWDPGEFKTLSKGEKASVTFTVWPSQEAMDCIASLRNDGACKESDLEKFGLGYDETNDDFWLITNSTATFRFKTATKNEDTGEITYSEISIPINFSEKRDDTTLPETELQVTKKWADELDPKQRKDIDEVSLELFVDGKKVRDYVFNEKSEDGSEWTGEAADAVYYYTVAPGVMKRIDNLPADEATSLRGVANENGGGVVYVDGHEYAILEVGHDYEFANENYDFDEAQNPNNSNHYQITKRTFHPMIVDDGFVHDVVFDKTNKTAVIDSIAMTKLSAENTLKGGILVSKVVENNGVVDTTIEDEYEITIENIKNGDKPVSGEYRVNTYNADGSIASQGAKKTYTGTITEKIKTNQKIMVIDVPTGTTFGVKETQPEGYEEYTVRYQLMRKDKDGNEIISTAAEDIQKVFGNASAQAIVTNVLESGNLVIKKTVTATNGDLNQAREKEFSFTINFYESQDKEKLIKTDTETCAAVKHNETCTIKNVPKDWYYEIIEAAKPGFNDGKATTKTGTIVARRDNQVDFVNNYVATPISTEIVAHKAFVSGYQQFWINSDVFEFQLIGNNEIIDSQNATLSGSTVKFERSYTNPGTYNYIITEKTNNEDGSSAFRQGVHRLADDADIEVTVVVEDDGEGALKIKSISYTKADQTIYNLYEDTKTYGADKELEFTKVLEGRAWRSTDEFKFKITGSDGAPMPATKELTIKDSTTDHKANFGTIKYSEKDAGKTYTYTVSEEFDVPSVEAKNGKDEITFTVEVSFDKEKGTLNLTVSNYDKTFTNVYKTVNVTAAKVWDDEEDRDGLRKNYANYYVAVKNGEGKYVAYDKLSLEDKDDYSFPNLPEKNAEGETIVYEIVEASTCSGTGESIKCTEFKQDDYYTATVKNGVITNYHKPALYNKTGELTVQKIWDDEGSELARREVVMIELYANGKIVGDPVPVSSADGWKHTFKELYLNEDGTPITYSVQESKIGDMTFGEDESVIIVYAEDNAIVGSWTKSVDNEKYEVTNTWKDAKDEVIYEGDKQFTIKKVDENYKPLSDVVFAVKGHTDKTTDKNGEITITVPISKNEKEESFEYKISEKEAKEGYDLVEGSANVTISCTSELSDKDTKELINTYTKTCTFSEEGDKAFNWNEEKLILTVVNKRSMAKSLTIKKTVEGLSAEILTDLEFTVKGPEDFGENGMMSLKASEDCTISEEMITCIVEGKVPTGKYTVTESNADVEHFELTVSGDNDVEKKITKNERAVFEITNKYEVEKIMYYVDKIWEDEHDKDGKRPKKLTINLLANGEIMKTVDLTMKDAYIIGEEDEEYVTGDIWGFVWEGLPYADEYAEAIVYTAEEVLESDEYEQLEVFGDEYWTAFVNYHELDDPCEKGGCGDLTPPITPDTGKFTGRRGGQSVATSNTIVFTLAIVMFVTMPIFAFVVSKRKTNTKK